MASTNKNTFSKDKDPCKYTSVGVDTTDTSAVQIVNSDYQPDNCLTFDDGSIIDLTDDSELANLVKNENNSVCDSISRAIKNNDNNAIPIIELVVGESPLMFNTQGHSSNDVETNGSQKTQIMDKVEYNVNITNDKHLIKSNVHNFLEVQSYTDNVNACKLIQNNIIYSGPVLEERDKKPEDFVIKLTEESNMLDNNIESIQNTSYTVVDLEDHNNELEDLLEEQIMLTYIKKMKSNLPVFRLKGVQEVKEDDITDNSDDANDETESIFNFEEDCNDETRKIWEVHDTISKALTINTIMQTDLNRFRNYLTKRLIEIRNAQERLEEEINIFNDSGERKKYGRLSKTKPYTKFGMPYFKDANLYPCPVNSDYKKMQLRGQILSLNYSYSKKWVMKDKAKLEEGVKKLLVEEETGDLCIQEECLRNELKDIRDKREKQEMIIKIKKIREQIDLINRKSIADLCLKPLNKNFAWIQVSMDFVMSHSDDECQRMWQLYVNPAINKKKWTAEEDERLLQLAKEQNYQDWDRLAERLATSRSCYQCFLNYQTRLNKSIKNRGKWTKNEDNRLIKMVEKCRVGEFIPWTKIAYYFQGRNLSQLYGRWHGSLNPEVKKGRFSKREDKLIILFVRKFGEDFIKISKMFGDRTSVQLRERYLRAVRGKYQNYGRWSLEEDKLLLSLIDKYGKKKFSVISKHFITRTRTQIRQRYQAITNLFSKNPGIKVEDIPRGPKAMSQLSVAAATIEEENSENTLLAFLGENKGFNNKENVGLQFRLKAGRKKITRRSSVDSQLISYFREAYISGNLSHNTTFLKPEDVDKAATVMLLFCRFLRTHINEANLDNDSLKKVPVTLRNVIKRMKEISSDWGCDCLTTGSLKTSRVCICQQMNSIDCFPSTRKSTMVEEGAFMLSSLPEYQKEYLANEKGCMCLKGGIKHILSYYLPPNLISAIGFRSVLLIKDKIAHSLSYDKVRIGYFSNFDKDILTHSLKAFPGFFSDESDSDDEGNPKETVVNAESSKVISSETSSLPSTSTSTQLSVKLDLCKDETKRLTYQDAIILWKERLLAILGWPITLSNQSSEFSSDMNTKFGGNTWLSIHKDKLAQSRKRKSKNECYLSKVHIFESNEVLKTVPIIDKKEARTAFQLFEDPLSDDESIQVSDNNVNKLNTNESEKDDCTPADKCSNSVDSCDDSQGSSSSKSFSMSQNRKSCKSFAVKYKKVKKVTKYYKRERHKM